MYKMLIVYQFFADSLVAVCWHFTSCVSDLYTCP